MGDIVSTELGGISIDIITGKFEASVSLYYLLEGEVDGVDTPHSIEQPFFLTIPPSSAIDAITSIAGITTTVATGGAVLGVGTSFKSLLEGIQTAHKVRSIQKKAGEIKSLPNLTVLGALPALFSLLSMQVKIRKKKATEDEIRTYDIEFVNALEKSLLKLGRKTSVQTVRLSGNRMHQPARNARST
jgi:hypothetical protein